MKSFRDIRLEANLTQAALGQRIGVHISCIQLWEKGVRAIPAVRVAALAQALSVSEDDICNALVGEAGRRGRPVPGQQPPRMPEHVDPADCYAWTRREAEARDATRRFKAWASEEEQREAEATRLRLSANRPRYMHSYGEPLFGGPSPVPGRPRRS